jgi:hypothetical protein
MVVSYPVSGFLVLVKGDCVRLRTQSVAAALGPWAIANMKDSGQVYL